MRVDKEKTFTIHLRVMDQQWTLQVTFDYFNGNLCFKNETVGGDLFQFPSTPLSKVKNIFIYFSYNIS